MNRIFEEKEKALALAFKGAQENLALLAKTSADALLLAATGVAEKMAELNNLCKEYTDDRAKLVSLEKYESDQIMDRGRITTLENERGKYVSIEKHDLALGRIATLENWRSWVLGAAAVVGTFAGIVGAVMVRLVFHP